MKLCKTLRKSQSGYRADCPEEATEEAEPSAAATASATPAAQGVEEPGAAATASATEEAAMDSAATEEAATVEEAGAAEEAAMDSAPLGSASATPAAVEGATTKAASAASAMPQARELIYVSTTSRAPPPDPKLKGFRAWEGEICPPDTLWRERGSEMGFRQFARLLANSDGTDMGPIWDRVPGIKPTL